MGPFRGLSFLPLPYMVAEEIKSKQPQQRASALWTMFGSWLLILVFAICTGGFADYWHYLSELLSGNSSISQLHTGELRRMGPTIAAMVALDILVMVPVMVLVRLAVRLQPGDHKLSNMFHTEKPKEQYLQIMTTLTLEELFARWLFLGVLGGIGFLAGGFWFYVLVFAGNIAWGLLHVRNLSDTVQLSWWRKIVFVVPQIIGGFMITAIYVPYGLLGAFIAHVIYDMVLFAHSRVDVFDRGEKMICVYHAIVGTGAATWFFYFGDQSILDMKRWLDNDLESFALPGWTFADYASAVVMLTSYAVLVLELLLYDREGGETKREVLRDWWHSGVFMLAAYVVVLGTRGVTYLPMAGVVIVLSMVWALFAKTASGSGVARIFWEGMLISSVIMGAILAMGPRGGLGLMMLIMVLWLPDRVMRFYDTDELAEEPCTCEGEAPKA